MFLFPRWTRKGRKERQLIKDAETREAERRFQQQERDYQQTQILLRSLCELRRTMDPLMAAMVYNDRFCPLISRLPEEILLCICDFLYDDTITLHCLRIASRIFFRLINPKKTFLVECSPEFRRLLQRDDRCDKCRHWNDAPGHQLSRVCKFQQSSRCLYENNSDYPYYRRLHCFACDSSHDVCQFSSTYQSPGYNPSRQCLGQQGSVQLCEHVQITWASVKAHIDNWRQQQNRTDWQACLESFSIECCNTDHDTRCTASETPTWPRARLCTAYLNSSIVVLSLEWKPHIRVDALALTADGRIPAAELRENLHRLRRTGPAETLCHPYRPGAPPEMALFGPSSCLARFVHYKTGENDALLPPLASIPSFTSQLKRGIPGCGMSGTKLVVKPHYIPGASATTLSSQCLAFSYEKDIMICKTTAITDLTVKIIPTHHWLHAMDTRTYPHPLAGHIRPQCRDESCNNYYRKPKDSFWCVTMGTDESA